jgi:hypothetical protein
MNRWTACGPSPRGHTSSTMLIKRSSPAADLGHERGPIRRLLLERVLRLLGLEIPIGVLRIEDVFSPSLLGTELDALVGEPGNGTWKLKVSSPSTSAFFINWSLNFFGSPPP